MTSAANTPDALLRRAKAGDAQAWGALLEMYQPYLRLVARSIIRKYDHSQLDVSDVVQETNFRACRARLQFQGSDEPELIAWLRRILTNLVVNELKKRQRTGRFPESLDMLLERAGEEVHLALAAPGSSPSAGVRRREQAVLTANALESLPPHFQQVLILRYLDKLSHKEIGPLMSRSDKASRMLLMRAAIALADKLREMP